MYKWWHFYFIILKRLCPCHFLLLCLIVYFLFLRRLSLLRQYFFLNYCFMIKFDLLILLDILFHLLSNFLFLQNNFHWRQLFFFKPVLFFIVWWIYFYFSFFNQFLHYLRMSNSNFLNGFPFWCVHYRLS